MRELKIKSINQNGAAILLAILVMSTILTAALATSKLVVNEVMQSGQIDHSTVAFYAAESGLEKGLFQVRQKELGASDLDQEHNVFDNNASYLLSAEDTEDVLYTSLGLGESYQVDFFDPYSLNDLINPIKAIGITWPAGEWLEIKWVSWSTSGTIGNPISRRMAGTGAEQYFQLLDNNAYLYSVRLVASPGPVSDIVIKAYNDVDPAANCQPLADCQVPVPARISLTSAGRYPAYGKEPAEQRISVTMPQRSPLSGLYDFVLYSEESIVKEN